MRCCCSIACCITGLAWDHASEEGDVNHVAYHVDVLHLLSLRMQGDVRHEHRDTEATIICAEAWNNYARSIRTGGRSGDGLVHPVPHLPP